MTAFNILCAGLIGTMFGVLLAFFGYRLFLVLLPIWGFFFGFLLGAETVQWLFNGTGLLVDVTGWVVGLVVGAIFAVLSYLFYIAAVAIIAGSLGYFIAVYGLLVDRYESRLPALADRHRRGCCIYLRNPPVQLAKMGCHHRHSHLLGAAVSFGTIIQILNPATNLLDNPVKLFLYQSWFLLLCFALMAAAGIVVQYVHNKSINTR